MEKERTGGNVTCHSKGEIASSSEDITKGT